MESEGFEKHGGFADVKEEFKKLDQLIEAETSKVKNLQQQTTACAEEEFNLRQQYVQLLSNIGELECTVEDCKRLQEACKACYKADSERSSLSKDAQQQAKQELEAQVAAFVVHCDVFASECSCHALVAQSQARLSQLADCQASNTELQGRLDKYNTQAAAAQEQACILQEEVLRLEKDKAEADNSVARQQLCCHALEKRAEGLKQSAASGGALPDLTRRLAGLREHERWCQQELQGLELREVAAQEEVRRIQQTCVSKEEEAARWRRALDALSESGQGVQETARAHAAAGRPSAPLTHMRCPTGQPKLNARAAQHHTPSLPPEVGNLAGSFRLPDASNERPHTTPTEHSVTARDVPPAHGIVSRPAGCSGPLVTEMPGKEVGKHSLSGDPATATCTVVEPASPSQDDQEVQRQNFYEGGREPLPGTSWQADAKRSGGSWKGATCVYTETTITRTEPCCTLGNKDWTTRWQVRSFYDGSGPRHNATTGNGGQAMQMLSGVRAICPSVQTAACNHVQQASLDLPPLGYQDTPRTLPERLKRHTPSKNSFPYNLSTQAGPTRPSGIGPLFTSSNGPGLNPAAACQSTPGTVGCHLMPEDTEGCRLDALRKGFLPASWLLQGDAWPEPAPPEPSDAKAKHAEARANAARTAQPTGRQMQAGGKDVFGFAAQPRPVFTDPLPKSVAASGQWRPSQQSATSAPLAVYPSTAQAAGTGAMSISTQQRPRWALNLQQNSITAHMQPNCISSDSLSGRALPHTAQSAQPMPQNPSNAAPPPGSQTLESYDWHAFDSRHGRPGDGRASLQQRSQQPCRPAWTDAAGAGEFSDKELQPARGRGRGRGRAVVKTKPMQRQKKPLKRAYRSDSDEGGLEAADNQEKDQEGPESNTMKAVGRARAKTQRKVVGDNLEADMWGGVRH